MTRSSPTEGWTSYRWRPIDKLHIKHMKKTILPATGNNLADVYPRQRWIRIAQMISDKLSHDPRWGGGGRKEVKLLPLESPNLSSGGERWFDLTLEGSSLITRCRCWPANILITAQYINYRACNLADARQLVRIVYFLVVWFVVSAFFFILFSRYLYHEDWGKN